MIEKWVIFKRDYLEISFLRENCGYDGSDERRRSIRSCFPHPKQVFCHVSPTLNNVYFHDE